MTKGQFATAKYILSQVMLFGRNNTLLGDSSSTSSMYISVW